MTELSYRTALIVGSGAGLSASLARTFTRAGMTVALAARRAVELAQLAKEIGGKAFACDATRRVEVIKLFADVEATFRAPDVVVYNASYRTRGPVSCCSWRMRMTDIAALPIAKNSCRVSKNASIEFWPEKASCSRKWSISVSLNPPWSRNSSRVCTFGRSSSITI